MKMPVIRPNNFRIVITLVMGFIFLVPLTACSNNPRTKVLDDGIPMEQIEQTPDLFRDAVTEYKRGNIDAAQKLLTEAMAQGNQTALAYNFQGVLFQVKDQHENAIVSFTRSIEIDPSIVDSLNNRALSKQALGDQEGAETDFREAIRLNPEFGQAHYNLLEFRDAKLSA